MFQLDAVKLRALLFEKKISASKLAGNANLTAKTVAKLIQDGAKANAKTIGKLADALKCNGEELILKEV